MRSRTQLTPTHLNNVYITNYKWTSFFLYIWCEQRVYICLHVFCLHWVCVQGIVYVYVCVCVYLSYCLLLSVNRLCSVKQFTNVFVWSVRMYLCLYEFNVFQSLRSLRMTSALFSTRVCVWVCVLMICQQKRIVLLISIVHRQKLPVSHHFHSKCDSNDFGYIRTFCKFQLFHVLCAFVAHTEKSKLILSFFGICFKSVSFIIVNILRDYLCSFAKKPHRTNYSVSIFIFQSICSFININ